jgi:transposase
MVTKGMSINGIADVLKSKPSTISGWISRGSEHCEKVTNVILRDVETPKVEMDELWTFVGEKRYLKTASMTTKEHGSG